jgi:hypothetical protein
MDAAASVRRRGVGSPELMPQEVAPGRNGRVCGVQTVGHMRSMWTTARANTARADAARADAARADAARADAARADAARAQCDYFEW